jgi:hypothetical protein
MRPYIGLRELFASSLCCVSLACGGSTPPAEQPSSSDGSTDPSASQPMVESQSLEVGMTFEDKDDERRSTASHEAPPTAAWQPIDKEPPTDLKKRPGTPR